MRPIKKFVCLLLMLLLLPFPATAESGFSIIPPAAQRGTGAAEEIDAIGDSAEYPPDGETAGSGVVFVDSTYSVEPLADVSGPRPALPLGGADEPWPREIVITVGGDCTIGSTDYQRSQPGGFPNVIKEKGVAWPFSGLLEVFARDDLTLVNFEGTFTESKNKVEKKFNFKGPAEYAEILALGSVEAVNLANNHFGDYGDQGREDTKAALDAYNIVYSAPRAPVIYETRGVKIGLIGNTFYYKDGKCDISRDVKALRDKGCQIVIASFHWGSEYSYQYTREQRALGRAAIQAGADAVVGHHPHVIQGIEFYQDTYILYSLGNLVFGGNMSPDYRDAYIAQLTFIVHENGEAEGPALKIIPIRLTTKGSGTDYRPVLAEVGGESYKRIMGNLQNRSFNMKEYFR